MRTMSSRLIAAPLLPGLLMLCLAGFGACSRERKHESALRASRLVLVMDPTVLRDANAAEFNRRLGNDLRRALADLPEDTYIDLFFVGLGQTGLPVDYRAELPFNENEGTEEGHLARAKVVSDSIMKLVEAQWAASSEQPNRPASCILTALYRAGQRTKLGVEKGENVTLVLVSDLLEACSETGYNFEREIPDSIGALPVAANLSGADRVVMLRMQTSGAVDLSDDPRLIRLWTDVLKRWQVDEGVVEFTPDFPDSLVEAAKQRDERESEPVHTTPSPRPQTPATIDTARR